MNKKVWKISERDDLACLNFNHHIFNLFILSLHHRSVVSNMGLVKPTLDVLAVFFGPTWARAALRGSLYSGGPSSSSSSLIRCCDVGQVLKLNHNLEIIFMSEIF